MDLRQLQCFVAVAETLHFGRAAQNLAMMPAALGRQVRLLEESLGIRLFNRTTRSVELTQTGEEFLKEAQGLLKNVDALKRRFKNDENIKKPILKIGAIDSASAGLMPRLIGDFEKINCETTIHLIEEKTVRLMPRILNGGLDIALIRPPKMMSPEIATLPLFNETAVVAVPNEHPLAHQKEIKIHELDEQPMIVPERRSRPHSHDLTIKLFAEADLQANIALVAEEKHTIINLVAAEIGLAIVPRWASRLAIPGVQFIPLVAGPDGMKRLPLAAAWAKNTKDTVRDSFLNMLSQNKDEYAEEA